MVTVRTYNYARLADVQLANARVTAEAIFKGADISLAWLDCRVPQGDGASCTEPLELVSGLMLRLVEYSQSPGDRQRVVALGSSLLDRGQRSGVLMTIDVAPSRTIAGQASADFPTLLGRAIAHEIGHLLLGTSEHPREGLMRARWRQDEIRGLRPSHWRFSAREAAQMRQGLAIRARGTSEPRT